MVEDEVFWQALWNTVMVILSAPIGIAIALGLALLVNSDIRGRDTYRTIIFLSYPLMTVAVAIIWRWMFDERVGLINYVARVFHLVDKPIPFLNSFTWALPSVISANIWQMLGFYMIILLTGMQNIPGNLYEAAQIDGANAFRRFLRITLPLLKPSIFLCFVIGMLNSVTSFDLVYVMTAGGPGRATEILVTYIYKLGFTQTRFDYAAAVTVVFFVLLISVTWLANRLSGGNAGAVAHSPCPAGGQLHHAGAVLLGAENVGFRREHFFLSAEHRSAQSQPVLLRRCLVRDSVCSLLPQ
jgi:ABC-type sugar transport system permease subunit